MKLSIKTDLSVRTASRVADRCSKTENVVAVQVEKDTRPFVPMVTGSLMQRTRVIGNTIIYPGPASRYLYRGKAMVDSKTGKGPMKYKTKLGNEFIRFRKGAVLKPTSKDLNYTKDFHPDAGPYWFDRSKALNIDEWERVAQKAVNRFGK